MTYIRGMGHWALSGNQGAMAKIIKGRRGCDCFPSLSARRTRLTSEKF